MYYIFLFMKGENMQLALYILGVILGYILCSVLHNCKAHGEIFVIEKEGENPEVFVGIDNVEELLKHTTIQLTVKKTTQK